MNLEILKAVSPVLVAGYGQMGQHYVNILCNSGFEPSDILVVDREASKRTQCTAHHPHLAVYGSVEEALDKKPKTLLNITNSPEHARVMKKAFEAGVKIHFVEKPLVLPSDLATLHVPQEARVAVGYLINFSPAMEKLFTLMREQNLIVREGRGFWAKDRIGDNRPTAGDLEDEATHPLATLLSSVELNQRIMQMKVRADLSFIPYTDSEAQEKANQLDSSYPELPTATSHVALSLRTDDDRLILLTVNSSFVSFEQERRIELALSPADGERITHLARVEFDVQGEDTLAWRKAGSKEPAQRWAFPGKNKLADQLDAFFHYAVGGEKDPRLSDLPHAIRMVKITEAALNSNERGVRINLD